MIDIDFKYYKYQIKQILKMIPCVLRAFKNTFLFMIELWKDMVRCDNLYKETKGRK